MKIRAEITENREHIFTIRGRYSDYEKQDFISAIECAGSAEDALRELIDAGARDASLSPARQVGFDIAASIVKKG